MNYEFPILSNPPIAVAICQIKFPFGSIPLGDFMKFDMQIKNKYPIRVDNINAEIGVPDKIKLGENPFTGISKARINAHDYRTKEQDFRFHISEDSLLISDEQPYTSWMDFKNKIISILKVYTDLLNGKNIDRVSLRFINRFSFDSFEDPSEYFNILISTSNGHNFDYDVLKYGFRLNMAVPQTDIISIINHNLETSPSQKFIYTLDIDVLDHTQLVFNLETIESRLDKLRVILSGIFFNNITDKTLALCN